MQQERTAEIAWAAGLFEGEGCFNVYRRKSGKLQVQMRLGTTDRDVVERFARIVGCGQIGVRQPGTSGHKPLHEWSVYESLKVQALIELLLPYLGERRRAKAAEVLDAARTVRPHNEKKTHCPKGHPLSADNLQVEPITRAGKTYIARRCKTCRREQSRARARKRLGIAPERYRIE